MFMPVLAWSLLMLACRSLSFFPRMCFWSAAIYPASTGECCCSTDRAAIIANGPNMLTGSLFLNHLLQSGTICLCYIFFGAWALICALAGALRAKCSTGNFLMNTTICWALTTDAVMVSILLSFHSLFAFLLGPPCSVHPGARLGLSHPAVASLALSF